MRLLKVMHHNVMLHFFKWHILITSAFFLGLFALVSIACKTLGTLYDKTVASFKTLTKSLQKLQKIYQIPPDVQNLKLKCMVSNWHLYTALNKFEKYNIHFMLFETEAKQKALVYKTGIRRCFVVHSFLILFWHSI